MRKLWLRFPIKVGMIALFLAISLASAVLMGVFSHANYSRAVRHDFQTVADEATKRLNYHTAYYLGQIANSTRTFTNTELFQKWYEGEELSAFERDEIQTRLSRYVALNYSEITGMFLKSLDGRVLVMRSGFANTVDLRAEPWFQVPFSPERVLIPTHEVAYTRTVGIQVISIISPVYSTQTLQPIGSIVIDIVLDEIEAIFERSRLGKTGIFMMLAEDDTIVYHPLGAYRGMKLEDTPMRGMHVSDSGGVTVQHVDGKRTLVSASRMDGPAWRIAAIVPFDEMASGLYAARNATLLSFFLVAVLAVFLVPLAADLFVKPVLELKRNLDKVFQGDYSVRMNVCPGRNELMKLGHSFNRMTEQLNHQLNTIADLRVQELQARLREKEAQIRALQNQINPHLLYNSLDVIKSIALLNDDRLVVGMAGNLADVYRYTAKMSDGEVTLKTELTALEKYLEITRIRFPKKFRSRITVHPRYYGCLLLKLTLQPIVENAVKYAVEPQGGNAAIIVNAYAHGNDLMIEIANNGEPFPEDKLKQLTERLNRITDSGSYREDGQSGSLGLVNVHARLVLKYGERYGVSITAIPQRGTVVSVRVPLRYGDERC